MTEKISIKERYICLNCGEEFVHPIAHIEHIDKCKTKVKKNAKDEDS